MTYWERICCAIRKGAPGSAHDINLIEIYYDDGQGALRPSPPIQGGDDCYDFLSTYSTFTEVQEAYQLPGVVTQICCVNILDEVNLRHFGIASPRTALDKGTIEIFYSDASLSMLEQELAGCSPSV